MSKPKKQKTEGSNEKLPIPEPLSVDYAPTSRASCKKCQGSIAEGSVRVGRLVRSRFHDGFDTQLYHWRCGSEYGSSIDDFRGWQSVLRWGGPNDDVERLLNTMGDQWIEDRALIDEYQRRNQFVHTAAEHLSDVPVGLLRQVFEANDMVFSDRAKGADLARVIADCMLYGRLPSCPTCNTNGLRQEGTDIRCHGWFSASTKCDFKFRIANLVMNRPDTFGTTRVGDELMLSRITRNGRINLPEDVSAHKAFKTLIIPKELQVALKKLSGPKGASGGGLATSVMATLDSEDEDIETCESKHWLLGMRFVLCGLSHAEQQDLSEKITAHGGILQEDVIVAGPERTTHLVISEDEIFKDPKSSRYRRCNEAGIPIVKENFIDAITDQAAVDALIEAKDELENVVEVSGRSKKSPNAIINGKYLMEEGAFSADRPVFKKAKDSKCPELFLFFSAGRQKWKIAPSLDDGKGHVAINNDAKAERPQLCSPGHWEVFDGKDKGFNVDKNVVVSKRSSKRKNAVPSGPAGPLLRQRKYLKSFIVEGSVGKKLPKIQDILIAASTLGAGSGKLRKKRVSPIPGSPIVTVDEEAAGEFPDAQIFVDSHNNVYNVLLTKTDSATNQNKFYAIQLLAYRGKKQTGVYQYAVYRKWGRFGSTSGPMNGSLAVQFGPNKNEAIDAFKEKFNECTGLEFEVRDIAPQKPGRYMYVELAGQHEEAAAKATAVKKKEKGGSKQSSELAKELVDLIELIFDLEMIEREMNKSMDIDTSRLPPNALSRRQLANGLAVLRELERFLNPSVEEEGEGGKENEAIDGPTRDIRLKDCSNRFYSIVPHSFDRKEVVPVIDNIKLLRKRIRTLEDLLQIVELEEMRVASATNALALERPLVDVQYEELNCKLGIVSKDAVEWNLINKVIQDTHAGTHSTYTLSVDKIFKVERDGEMDRFLADPCQSNKRMLWHGSRLSNWASILKNGLRIAPKEAPVTGYMFGKGVYFADSSSKSANYCFATPEEPDGLLVLCDVALGSQLKRLEAYYEAPRACRKKGMDSTWGVGQDAPLETASFPDGSVINCGKLVPNVDALELAKVDQPRGKPTLLYNEYIVYRETQLVMKYVVHVKFNFSK
jgi:poly [ADP-ribose] polymerase